MASPDGQYESIVQDMLSPYPQSQEDTFMQRFIQSHMTSILQPVAEHVRELQEQMQRVARNLAQCDMKLEQTRTTLGQRSSDLSDLTQTVTEVTVRLDKLTAGHGAMSQDNAAIHVELDMTKAQLNETRGTVAANGDALKALQRKVQEHVEGGLVEVQTTAARNEKTLAEHAQRLAQLDDICNGQNFQHLDLQKSVEALSRSCSASAQSLTTHLKEFAVRKDQDTARFEKANEYIAAVEQLCGDAMRHSQRNEDNLRSTDGLVRHLRSTVDSQTWAATKVEAAEQRWREAGRSLEDQSGRVAAVEKAFDLLKRDMLSSKGSTAEGWKDLLKRTDAQGAEIRQLEAMHVAQAKAMNMMDLGLGDVKAEGKRLQEKMEAVEVEVSSSSTGLQKWLQDAGQKLDAHSSQLANARLDIGELQRNMEAKGRSLRDLSDGLNTTNETVTQLQNGHRAYMKSLQGLTKGFQETYKQVTFGEGGMLAPKSNGVPASPAGRAASTSSSTAGYEHGLPEIRPSTASSTCTPRSEVTMNTQASGWPTPPRSDPPERGHGASAPALLARGGSFGS